MLAVNKTMYLIVPYTHFIHDQIIRLSPLKVVMPMLTVRPLHVPVEWLVGREEGINRLERSTGRLGVNY